MDGGSLETFCLINDRVILHDFVEYSRDEWVAALSLKNAFLMDGVCLTVSAVN